MSQKTRERYETGRKVEAAAVPAVVQVAPVWNGLRRLWMVDGVAVDPQPAAPSLAVEFSLDSGRLYGPASAPPPSVKVSA
jgi:hypothetical protein